MCLPRCALRLVAALLALAAPLLATAGNPRVFGDGFEAAPSMRVESPLIQVDAGSSATWCYHFASGNSVPIAVRRWSSMLGASVTHAIVYATYDNAWQPQARQPAGTLTQAGCGLDVGAGLDGWVYAAHDPLAELVFPADDGQGVPLAFELQPQQPLVLQMRVVNPTSEPLQAGVSLEAEAIQPGNPYTRTATYRTTNRSFTIPPNAVGSSVQQTCATPASTRFWWLSTRTHRRGVESRIVATGNDVVISTDWEHPSIAEFGVAPFFDFGVGGLTYRCVYDNPDGSSVTPGASEESDEACMAIGWYFPAVRPALCVNNIGPL